MAKKNSSNARKGERSGSRNALREKVARQKRNQNLLIGGIAAVVVLLVGIVVVQQIRRTQPVVGETSLASLGNNHIAFGSTSPVAYNSTPPTSGPHYENIVAWGVYNEPQRYEHLVHNLEDGGIVIYYQCADGCPDLVSQLEALVQPYLASGRHVVLAPNDPTWNINGGQALQKDMGATIAVTAWQRILKLDEVDEAKIRAFIERYEGLDHHVAGIG
jgi:hypothetical protein